MANGIQKKEIADLITEMNKADYPDSDEHLWDIFKRAITKALRLGEESCKIAKTNRYLLILLLIVSIKGDVWSLIMYLVKTFGG